MLFKKKAPPTLAEENIDDAEEKEEKSGGCLDAVLELGIELALIALGAGVLAILGFSFDSEWIDPDMLGLVGVGAVAVVGVVAFLIYKIFKKKRPQTDESEADREHNEDKE